MDRLIAIAAGYQVRVQYATLDHRHRGIYVRDAARIFLSRRLTPLEARCTLAHELGHVYWGHNCSALRFENQANDYACRLLVHPEAYAAAERLYDSIEDIAEELGVTPEMVTYYQRFGLQRLGERTYARESHIERTMPRRVVA